MTNQGEKHLLSLSHYIRRNVPCIKSSFKEIVPDIAIYSAYPVDREVLP